MREKLIELLMRVIDKCDDQGCEGCEYAGSNYCSTQRQADLLVKSGVTITKEKDLKRTASRNYEAEYHELHHKYNQLYADHQAMETEFVKMRAQLDIVCLIFGGK